MYAPRVIFTVMDMSKNVVYWLHPFNNMLQQGFWATHLSLLIDILQKLDTRCIIYKRTGLWQGGSSNIRIFCVQYFPCKLGLLLIPLQIHRNVILEAQVNSMPLPTWIPYGGLWETTMSVSEGILDQTSSHRLTSEEGIWNALLEPSSSTSIVWGVP